MSSTEVVDLAARTGVGSSEDHNASTPSAPRSDEARGASRSIVGLVRRSFVFLFAMILLAGATGFGSVLVVTGRIDRLTQGLEPLASANASLLQALVNAETGERGYLLTRRPSFLVPYRQGMAAFPEAASSAMRLVANEPAGRRLLQKELLAGKRWIDRYAQPTIRATAALPTAPASDSSVLPSTAPSLSEGKDLLNGFRTANAALQHWVQSQIAAADRASHRTQWLALATIAAITAIAVSVGSVAAFQTYRAVVPPLQDLLAVLRRHRSGEPNLQIRPAGASEVRAVDREVNRLTALSDSARKTRAYRDQLRAVATELGHRVSQRLTIEDLLAEASGRIGSALGVDLAWILLDDDQCSNHLWRVPTLLPIATTPTALRAALLEVVRVTGSRACRLELDRSETTEQAPALPASLRAAARHSGLRSMVVCPLHAGDEALGVLLLGRSGLSVPWEEPDVDLVESIAADIVRATLNAQLYEKQRAMVQRLQALDRQKDEFVATVSHELRSPLTSIRGYLELLHDGDAGPLEPSQEAMVDVIQRNASRLGVLIEDLLALSRLESSAARLHSEPIQLCNVVEAVLGAVHPEVERKGLELVSVTDGSDLWVRGDADALEQVVLNLMANAVKFTPAGGTVTISQASGAGCAVVTVADTGIGIPGHDQAHLFERFFRASNATAAAIPGTGLGLHIVSRIVSQHRGTIRVESEDDQGATFTVSLPSIDALR